MNHFPAHVEQLVRFSHLKRIFLDIHGDSHKHLVADCQQFPDHVHLHRGKASEAVQ